MQRPSSATCSLILVIFLAFTLSYCGGNSQPLPDPSNSYFVYAGDGNDGGITGYFFDPSKSVLQEMSSSPFSSGSPTNMVIHSSRKFLVATDFRSNTITVFSIVHDGTLSTVSSATPSGTSPGHPVFDPSGKFLFVSSADRVSAFSFGPSSGAIEPLPGFPILLASPSGIAFSRDGQFAFVPMWAQDTLLAFSIDPTTHVLGEPVSSVATGPAPARAVMHPSGNYLYVDSSDSSTVSAFSVNTATGELTEVSGSPFEAGHGVFGIDITPSGRYLVSANTFANTISVFAVADDGTLSDVPGSPFIEGQGPNWVKISPTGDFVAVSRFGGSKNGGSVAIYSLDPASGRLQFVSSAPAGVSPNQMVFFRPNPAP